MIDSMVKQLDPNHPSIRESLQNIVTINFAELVKIFPTVSFHAPTQRLAVGTLDGTSIVYDLRTATKLNVLEVNYFYLGPCLPCPRYIILPKWKNVGYIITPRKPNCVLAAILGLFRFFEGSL
jgi:hypothetical protein